MVPFLSARRRGGRNSALSKELHALCARAVSEAPAPINEQPLRGDLFVTAYPTPYPGVNSLHAFSLSTVEGTDSFLMWLEHPKEKPLFPHVRKEG